MNRRISYIIYLAMIFHRLTFYLEANQEELKGYLWKPNMNKLCLEQEKQQQAVKVSPKNFQIK